MILGAIRWAERERALCHTRAQRESRLLAELFTIRVAHTLGLAQGDVELRPHAMLVSLLYLDLAT